MHPEHDIASLIDAALRDGRIEDAENAMRNTRSPLHGNIIARVLLAQNKISEAIAIIENELEADRDWYLLGDCYCRSSRPEDAIRSFRRVLVEHPRDYRAWWALGSCYDDRQDWARARDCYREASYLQPENGALHYNIGNTYLDEQLYSLARGEYSTAMSLGYKTPELYSNWAIASRECGDPEEAARLEVMPKRLKQSVM